MNNEWAAGQLQTIRLLMERSSLYRRALAPVTLFCGIMGLAAGVVGHWLRIASLSKFVGFWFAVALVTLVVALVLVRRQALKDAEPFWSPPTRRIAQMLLLPFVAGTGLGLLFCFLSMDEKAIPVLISLWLLLYGCALNAAGFFMQRGIRWLGWVFGFAGLGLLACAALPGIESPPNLLMSATFGALHLLYGIYLYFTEKRDADL